jgi:hypothetical protein
VAVIIGAFCFCIDAKCARTQDSAGEGSQDQSAATPNDAILARKTVVDALGDKMDIVEAMTASGKKIDPDAAHANADAISVFLIAFPHLFPPSTNQWKPNVDNDQWQILLRLRTCGPSLPTSTGRQPPLQKAAYNASRAQNEADFKASIAQLRTGCNDCHAAYLKMD